MITIKKEAETKKLYTLGLQFGQVVNVVKKYWDAKPGLVYIIYYNIGH